MLNPVVLMGHFPSAWRKVDPSMVSHKHSNGVLTQLKSDESGGLKVVAKVTEGGCGKDSKSASLIVHIKGDWQQIMYTQVFKGSCKCWAIFGQE